MTVYSNCELVSNFPARLKQTQTPLVKVVLRSLKMTLVLQTDVQTSPMNEPRCMRHSWHHAAYESRRVSPKSFQKPHKRKQGDHISCSGSPGIPLLLFLLSRSDVSQTALTGKPSNAGHKVCLSPLSSFLPFSVCDCSFFYTLTKCLCFHQIPHLLTLTLLPPVQDSHLTPFNGYTFSPGIFAPHR